MNAGFERMSQVPGAAVGFQGGYQNTPAFPGARLSNTYEEFRLTLPAFGSASPTQTGNHFCPPSGLYPMFSLGLTQARLYAPQPVRNSPATIADKNGVSGSVGLTYRFENGFQLGAAYRFAPNVLDVPGNNFMLRLGLTFPLIASHENPIPIPTTTSRPPGVSYSPPASPTPAPNDGPVSTTPPTVEATPHIVDATPSPTPTPTPCSYRLTDGWFEPTQGLFQDDPTFVEKPAVFTRTSSAYNNIQYYAPLYMIDDRPTVLAGVNHYRDGELGGKIVHVDSRDAIVFKGETNCTKPAGVSLKFTLLEHGARHRIYSTGVLAQIPLSGKARKQFTPFTVTLHASHGIPPSDTFTISKTTPDYAIVGEIVKHEGGVGTGMRVTVEGLSVPTIGPQLLIVPVLIDAAADRDSNTMIHMSRLARIWQQDLYNNVPDIFPLRPHGLPMPDIAPVLDLAGEVLTIGGPSIGSIFKAPQRDNLVAAVGDRLATMGTLANAGRIVVMLRKQDYRDFYNDTSLGVSWNNKVVAIRDNGVVGQFANDVHGDWTTVAHEVAHTLPHYVWSSPHMLSECGLDYHNGSGSYGHGLRIMFASLTGKRAQINNNHVLMEAGMSDDEWISQCTYHNLIGALMQNVDPPIMLVRGFIAQSAQGEAARFAPSYDLMGVADLTAPGQGSYAFLVHDSAGALIARYRFTPAFVSENGRVRRLVSFGFHIPQPPKGARIDLVGPHGNLASLVRSADAPTLDLAPPVLAANHRSIHLHWSASSAGHKVLASVLTTQHSRAFWPQVFEREISSADIPVEPRVRQVRVKVVVTDGSRSSDKTITVNVPATTR